MGAGNRKTGIKSKKQNRSRIGINARIRSSVGSRKQKKACIGSRKKGAESLDLNRLGAVFETRKNGSHIYSRKQKMSIDLKRSLIRRIEW